MVNIEVVIPLPNPVPARVGIIDRAHYSAFVYSETKSLKLVCNIIDGSVLNRRLDFNTFGAIPDEIGGGNNIDSQQEKPLCVQPLPAEGQGFFPDSTRHVREGCDGINRVKLSGRRELGDIAVMRAEVWMQGAVIKKTPLIPIGRRRQRPDVFAIVNAVYNDASSRQK